MVLMYERYPGKTFAKSDNFYGSTQGRLYKYTADRRIEQHNGEIQQAKVYQQLAEDRGDIESADRLAKLGTMIINKFGQQVQAQPVSAQPITEQPFDIRNYLKQAIDNGTLSNIWDAIKKIPKSKLSPIARVIQGDVKYNKTFKSVVNEKVMTYKQNESTDMAKDILDDIIQTIVGSKENESALSELAQKAGLIEDIMKQTRKSGPSSVASSSGETEMSEAPMEIPSFAGRKPLSPNTVQARINLVLNVLKDKSKVTEKFEDMPIPFQDASKYLRNNKYFTGSWKNPTWSKKKA